MSSKYQESIARLIRDRLEVTGGDYDLSRSPSIALLADDLASAIVSSAPWGETR